MVCKWRDGYLMNKVMTNALIEALGLAYEALSGSDEQTETASAAAYDALEAAK